MLLLHDVGDPSMEMRLIVGRLGHKLEQMVFPVPGVVFQDVLPGLRVCRGQEVVQRVPQLLTDMNDNLI